MTARPAGTVSSWYPVGKPGVVLSVTGVAPFFAGKAFSGFSFLTAGSFFSPASVSTGPATGSFVRELKR